MSYRTLKNSTIIKRRENIWFPWFFLFSKIKSRVTFETNKSLTNNNTYSIEKVNSKNRITLDLIMHAHFASRL